MFDSSYRAVVADNDESRAIHFNLRYQVYCLEKKFEPTERFQTQQEIDQYDARSIHFLIQHRYTGEWVGTARLVLGTAESLPIAQHAEFSLPVDQAPGKTLAELSRLSIMRSFRLHGRETRASEPEILLGLIRAAREYSNDHGIDSWLFLCRRSIMRIVGNLGMEMRIIGSPCEHRGIRYPYFADMATAFDGIPARSSAIAAMFARRNMLTAYSSLHSRSEQSLAA